MRPSATGRTPTWMWLLLDSLLYGVVFQGKCSRRKVVSASGKGKDKDSLHHLILLGLFVCQQCDALLRPQGWVCWPPSHPLLHLWGLKSGSPNWYMVRQKSPARPPYIQVHSQLFIFLKNGMRQMFIQVVDQPGCFVFIFGRLSDHSAACLY